MQHKPASPKRPAGLPRTGEAALQTAAARLAVALSFVLVLGAGCSGIVRAKPSAAPAETSISAAQGTLVVRDSDVPDLPFPDNPDPNACGIPAPWGAYSAWVNGAYQGEIVEPLVFLYDSHSRIHITGTVPSGTKVQVELYQSNPVLDFYFVRAETPAGPQKGWVPGPFLQFSPP